MCHATVLPVWLKSSNKKPEQIAKTKQTGPTSTQKPWAKHSKQTQLSQTLTCVVPDKDTLTLLFFRQQQTNLTGCKMSPEVVEQLAEALKVNQALHVIDLSSEHEI